MQASEVRFPGVYVAMSTPFRAEGSLDLDALQRHVARLVEAGVHGLVPNGSLGEYEALSDEERSAVVRATIGAAGGSAEVVPGVSAKTGPQARAWAEDAAAAGCRAVMCLPPTSHAPSSDEVVAHFAEVARAGLAIIAYNNPFSTRVDLTPELLARLSEIEQVVAVKEFSQDVRRVAAIRQAAPRLEVICGCDDTFVEAMLMGATGWIAGFANALPAESVALYELCAAGKWEQAVEAYVPMLPLLRWDADARFVQAIKLVADELGGVGGPVRLPRLALSPEDASLVALQLRAYLEHR